MVEKRYIFEKGIRLFGLLFLKKVFETRDEQQAREAMSHFLGNGPIRNRLEIFAHTIENPKTIRVGTTIKRLRLIIKNAR